MRVNDYIFPIGILLSNVAFDMFQSIMPLFLALIGYAGIVTP